MELLSLQLDFEDVVAAEAAGTKDRKPRGEDEEGNREHRNGIDDLEAMDDVDVEEETRAAA